MRHLLDAYDEEWLEHDYETDGPAACDNCGETYPASALWDGVCADCAAEWRYAAALLTDETEDEQCQ